jgi:hypothetical protein
MIFRYLLSNIYFRIYVKHVGLTNQSTLIKEIKKSRHSRVFSLQVFGEMTGMNNQNTVLAKT